MRSIRNVANRNLLSQVKKQVGVGSFRLKILRLRCIFEHGVLCPKLKLAIKIDRNREVALRLKLNLAISVNLYCRLEFRS